MIDVATVTDDLQIAELADLLRVISEEKRLRILSMLVRREMCVCEIMGRLEVSQPLVSHHLAVLRRTGLVRDRHEAQWVYYSIDPDRLAELNVGFLNLLGTEELTPEAEYGASPHKCV